MVQRCNGYSRYPTSTWGGRISSLIEKLGVPSTEALISWLDELFPAEQSDPAMENIPQPQSLGTETEKIFAEETPIVGVPISSLVDPLPEPPASVDQLPEPPPVINNVVPVSVKMDEITEERPPPRKAPAVQPPPEPASQPVAVVDWDEEIVEDTDDFTTTGGIEDWEGYTDEFYAEQDLMPMLLQHFAAALIGAMGCSGLFKSCFRLSLK